MDTTGSERDERRRERLQDTLDRIERGQYSQSERVVNDGPWVVVATLPTSAGLRGVAQMSNAQASGVHDMQRYQSAEQAIAGGYEHAAVRIGGGWVVNLDTGVTVRIRAGRKQTL